MSKPLATSCTTMRWPCLESVRFRRKVTSSRRQYRRQTTNVYPSYGRVDVRKSVRTKVNCRNKRGISIREWRGGLSSLLLFLYLATFKSDLKLISGRRAIEPSSGGKTNERGRTSPLGSFETNVRRENIRDVSNWFFSPRQTGNSFD